MADANLEQALDQADSVGQTSVETAQDESTKKSFSFSVYDGMLLLALISVTAATLLLFYELREFGNFPSVFPWRTSEVLEGSGLLWRI